MDKLQIIKTVASAVVGYGSGLIVGGIIKNNTTPENAREVVAIASAGMVIGSMVSKATKKHTDAMIDDAVETVVKIKNLWNKKTKKTEETEEVITEETPTIEGEIVAEETE
jgi:hypothetical protein